MREEILAEARKAAEEAELFSVTAEETQVHFETNRLKRIQTRQATSLALRVVKDGRIGFSLTTDTSRPQELIDSALETARFGMAARFVLPGPTVYALTQVHDAAVGEVPLENMVRLGQEMIEAIRAHTPEVICEAGVSWAILTVQIMNSRGGQAAYSKSIFSLGIEGTLIRGTDMLFVGESESSCHPLTETKGITGSVIRQLELAREQVPISSGELPVIFTPHGVASVLMPSLMAGFNGKMVLEGASPLGGRLGQAAFDSKFWLYDDATVPYQPQSRPCDDEGVPSQRTGLVEGGRIAGFLYDLQTAALAGTRSTGSAGRARGGLPSPSPSAFIIAPGRTSFEEMLQDVREGLVIEQVLGAEQGNILGGDFGGNVLLGYKIDKGKITGRVKNTMITGNVYEALKDIVAIGSEARWVGGSIHTPPICCPRISVAAKPAPSETASERGMP